MKKFATMAISILLIACMVAGGSLAYLTSEDSDVNVMTLGNVEIKQIEQERDADGNLVDFTQDKPAYPAVGDIAWADKGVDVNGTEYKVFDDGLKNVVDKIVTVENKGKSPAYVRTIIAIEAPEGDPNNLIHVNVNSDDVLSYTPWTLVEIDDTDFVYSVFTYDKALASGAISVPSLMQLFLDSAATNEDCEKLGDTWEVRVLSQAVQVEGFGDAETALNTGFGVPEVVNEETGNKNVVDWFKGMKASVPGEPAPADARATYNGTTYNTLAEAVEAANKNDGGEIILLGSGTISETLNITSNITIKGECEDGAVCTYTRNNEVAFTGTMFKVSNGATLTLENVALDGAGATATGNLIATEANSHIVLNAGAVLQNNNGAHAVNLGTRIGATLTLDGGEIINNSSDSGAIWGGGNITINSGKINNNSSTGIGGAIRMVSNCNLTMNGGEISYNKAAGDGGAIWGYGSSTYKFNGGKMNNNESAGTGGAIYTGDYSVINISDGFELCDNKAANSGAIRLTDHTSMTMIGGTVSGNTQNGESNAFNTWNNSISITGGTVADNLSFVGGLGLTIGAADIDGVISYNLSTNHNTAYLAADFGSFKFKVNETDEHFCNFNFKPAADYTYTAGDEAKLVCMNDGYSTYWDATTGTFRLQAK